MSGKSEQMGDFVVNCMVSGLPIPKGTPTKILFLQAQERLIGHCCNPYDMYQFASHPIDITMDEFGGFGDTLVPEGKFHKKLTKQIAWRLFFQQLVSIPEVDKNDWHRNMINGDTGLFTKSIFPITWAKKTPTIKDGIEKTYMTYIRKDIWNFIVNGTKNRIKAYFKKKNKPQEMSEFEKRLREECKRAATEFNDTIMWGNFITPQLQRLIVRGKLVGTFQGQTLYDITLSKDEQEQLIKKTVEMSYFVSGLDNISRPILPAISMAPQSAQYDNKYLKTNKSFYQKCNDITQKLIDKAKAFN